MGNSIKVFLQIFVEVVFLPYIFFRAVYSRFKVKQIDIGLGPQPLINNVYHKQALELYGYRTETFISNPFYITNDFDIVLSEKYNIKTSLGQFRAFLCLIELAFKYKILYFYFNGGPLGVSTKLICKFEAFFYKIANIKTVVMPYGSDVQEMSRSKNLYFKHTLNIDYSGHRHHREDIAKRIDYWVKNASHIISGCEWVDYMYAWDTLMLAHFSINTDVSQCPVDSTDEKVFKIFHAPNHKAIKGSEHLIKAVADLKNEGFNIELVMLHSVSNQEILQTIQKVDLVADQFVIGWYAMFALEAMNMQKPVLCYVRDDLEKLYIEAGLLLKDELPVIKTDVLSIREKLVWAYSNRDELKEIGKKSKAFVQKYHSLEAVGSVFDVINTELMESAK